jgi:hypothetical protein
VLLRGRVGGAHFLRRSVRRKSAPAPENGISESLRMATAECSIGIDTWRVRGVSVRVVSEAWAR